MRLLLPLAEAGRVKNALLSRKSLSGVHAAASSFRAGPGLTASGAEAMRRALSVSAGLHRLLHPTLGKAAQRPPAAFPWGWPSFRSVPASGAPAASHTASPARFRSLRKAEAWQARPPLSPGGRPSSPVPHGVGGNMAFRRPSRAFRRLRLASAPARNSQPPAPARGPRPRLLRIPSVSLY